MSTEVDTISAARGNRLPTLTWLLLGIATYWYASLALAGAISGRALFPFFMALAMGSPALAMALAAALMPVTPVFGYIAVRYWILPNRRRDWRNAIALPLITLAGMIVATIVASLVASLIGMTLLFLPAALYQLAVIVTVGLLAGLCLYGVERLTTRVLFGKAEAVRVRASLCGAHAVGLAAACVAASLVAVVSIRVFHVAISPSWARWLVLPSICGWSVHLLLTWRAWGSNSQPLALDAPSLAKGVVLGFVVLNLLGAMARLPRSAGLMQALAWPLSSIAGWPPT